jgi:hypothetical protein
MAVELASAYISLLPSFRGGTAALQREASKAGGTVSKSMSDEISKSGSSGGSIFKAFAGIAAAASGIFVGARIFKGFIDEATEAQVTSAQTAAVLKSTGGAAKVTTAQIGDLANALSLKAGVDDEVIQSGENVLLTFTKVRNEAGKGNDIFNQGTTVALDMSKALGTDLQGSVIQVGKALNDPVKGITALQRVGVSFTAEQKKQIKTLVDTGDTLGAQKVILKELNTEFGGAAAASATSGQKLQVAWKNVEETLGGLLLPTLSKVADWLAGVLPKAAGVATTVIGDVVGGVKDAVSYFTAGFTGDGSGEGTGILGFFNHLGMWAATAWDIIRTTVPKIVDAVRAAIDHLVAGFNFEDTSNNFFGRVGDNVRAAWDTISTVVPKIKDAIIRGVGAIADWVRGHWGDIKQVFADVYNAIANVVKFVVDNKPVLIGVLATIGGAFVAQAAMATAAAVASAAAWVIAAAIPIAIGVAIAALIAGLIYAYEKVNWFRAAVDGVAKAVVASVGWVRDNWRQIYDDIATVTVNTWNVIFNIVSTAVNVVRNVIGVAVNAIQFIWAHFGDQITATIQNAWNVISGVVTAAINIVRGIIQTVTALIHGDWSGVWNGIKNTLAGVWDGIKTLVSGALNTLRTGISFGVALLKVAWSPIADLATFVITNVVTPIRSAIDGLISWMVKAFNTGVGLIGMVWDGLKAVVKAPINIVIGFYNNGIRALWNFVADHVGLGKLDLPFVAGLNSGGNVPGVGDKDTVPAMLTPGEFVVRKQVAERPGVAKALEALNAGGTIDPGIFGYAGGGPVKSAAEAQAWAQAQAGKPYQFAAVGPNAFDCSGFTSALINFVLGLNPYQRRHSSGTVGSDPALRPGLDDPRGLSIGARPPYVLNMSGDFVGHTTSTIAGMNAEATPPAVRVGGNARGAAALPQHYFLPGFGGPNPDEQGMIAVLKTLLSLKLPGLGGGIGDLLSKLFVQLPKMAFDFLVTKVPQIVKDAIVQVGVGIGPSANPLGTAVGLIKSLPFLGDGGRVVGPTVVGDRGPEILWNSEGQYVESLQPGRAGPLMEVGAIFGDGEFRRMVRDELGKIEFARRASPTGARVA